MRGKVTLVKVVLQAILVYTMHYFFFSKSPCAKIEKVLNNFWWRNTKTLKKIHWSSWSFHYLPKLVRSLGFHDLSLFNLSFLAKQCWCIWTQPNCLLACVMKSHYFPHLEFLSSSLGFYLSYTWRSMLSARVVLENGFNLQIGNGDTVNIWNDPWLLGSRDGRIKCQNIDVRYTTVSQLINPNSGT